MGRKPKNAASGKCVVLAVEIDAGVVAPMMEDTPHVRIDSANIECIVQEFVYGRHRRDGVVVAVVGDVQQEKCLGEPAQKIEGNKPPRIRLECVEGNPAARQNRETHDDFDPHRAVSFGRNVFVGEEVVEAAA
jgi:hypothetical protein